MSTNRCAFGALILALAVKGAPGQLSPSAWWATTAPSNFQAHSNLTYLIVNGHASKLDIYRRRDKGVSEPTLMYFHGGGWASGNKKTA